jgi:alanine racemase
LFDKGVFKVSGIECPIVGAISMNITSIDVGKVSEIRTGDEVAIISNDKKDKNSVENIAKLVKKIPYEILVRVPQHLRRTVV